MREIVLDTETTGLDPNSGDRIVEIGCVEMINQITTGEIFHQYINPERHMPQEAFAIHGLSDEFLSDKPIFADVADSFMEFLGDARLIIHNAAFDISFLNSELQTIGRAPLSMDRTTDTTRLARKKFPGAPVNLDALCRRFDIDNLNRQLHGALLDAKLLADVYLELIGGRQRGLSLALQSRETDKNSEGNREIRPIRAHSASAEELIDHANFVSRIKNALWLN